MNDQQMRKALKAAEEALSVYKDLPKDRWPGPPTTALALVQAALRASGDDEFKNFHRLLCERFGYTHDERDWKRDQVSLIEWIAQRASGEHSPDTQQTMEAWAAKHVGVELPDDHPMKGLKLTSEPLISEAALREALADASHPSLALWRLPTITAALRKLGIHVQK